MSDTYAKLETSGFNSENSWKLVSKLVHRIFTTDCHLKRGMVSEILDATNSKVLSIGVLWGTFATHQVMRDYMKHGIENHPSISSEYVRFLVANAGLNKMEVLVEDVKKVKANVKDLTKSIKTVEKTATTASNKADQAFKEAKKK